jgi:hypothetical protein
LAAPKAIAPDQAAEAAASLAKAEKKAPVSALAAPTAGSARGAKTASAVVAEKVAKAPKPPPRSKYEVLQDALDSAQRHSGGAASKGYDVALGHSLNRILDNPKTAALFDEQERAAMRMAVRGDPAVRAGRQFGRLASLQGMASGGVGSAALWLSAHPFLAPAGIIGVPAAGYVGRSVANRGAKNLANRLSDIVNKRPQNLPALTPQQMKNVYNAIRFLDLQGSDIPPP